MTCSPTCTHCLYFKIIRRAVIARNLLTEYIYIQHVIYKKLYSTATVVHGTTIPQDYGPIYIYIMILLFIVLHLLLYLFKEFGTDQF